MEIVEDSKDSDCNTTSIIPDVSLLLFMGRKRLVMGNQYSSIESKIESLCKTVEKHIPGWEFVSKDGSKVTVRNTICHHERTIFYGTMFHLPEGLKCKECAKAEAKRKHEAEKEQRRISGAEDRFQKMKDNLHKHYPELEYVSGFTNCDGKVIVKAKCGHEREISLISVRHDCVDPECKECARIKREKEKEKKHKLIEYAKSQRLVKHDEVQIKECPICGTFYFGFEKDIFCSSECKETNRKRNANRYKETKKRRCRTEESKYINLLALYRRDNGICWLCGKPCDITLEPNDNYYPSIDHVFPVSLGGKDQWDNVKLAHRICNSIKSNETDLTAVNDSLIKYPLV